MMHRIKNLDFSLLGALFLLAVFSLLSLASSGMDFFWKQLLWYVVGFGLIIFGSSFDWRWLGTQVWFRALLYWGSVGLVFISNFLSGTVRGTKGWISIGGFQFEPAELVKLSVILVLSSYFARKHIHAWQTRTLFISLIFVLIPTVPIIMHPDFGSAAMVMVLWFGFILLSGINIKRFFIGVGCFLISFALLWMFVLKPYQKDRITGFFTPTRDPLGVNYNVIQSKIAIGSGGFFGKGFGMGTQVQFKFLPEAKTDFIFAAIVEEWGLFGGLCVIFAFFFSIYRVIMIGLRAKDNYFRFICLGAGVYFIAHFSVNVGSALGLLPVAGITFPFVSYGGSNLLTSSILLSIIQHIKLESST